MFMRSTKAALLTGAILAAVLAPAGAASAQKVVLEDSTADVWESVWDADASAPEFARAGSQPNMDIVRTVVRHTGHKLILTFKYADLTRSKTRFAVVNRLRFAKGPRMVAVVDTATRWRGTLLLGGLRAEKPTKCRNLGHAIDYAANTIVLSIPRSCIGGPKWVEVNTFAYGQSESGLHQYIDNAQNAGHGWAGWSPRIHQG